LAIQIEKNAIPNVRLIVLGNKSDMADKREVDPQEVRTLCEQRGIIHLEVSAKTGENV
jgi:hypothetical protein